MPRWISKGINIVESTSTVVNRDTLYLMMYVDVHSLGSYSAKPM
jgi:hypothetical protein